MQEKEILSLVGESLTDKSKTVQIDVKPKNWFQKILMKKGFLQSKLTFVISPISVGNRYRVSAVAVRLPDDTFEDGKLNLVKAWKAIHDHTEDFIYIVAVCIANSENEPPKSLMKRLRWLPEDKFMQILDASLSQAGVENFMKSIVWISGQSVLNVKEKAVTLVETQE